MEAILSSQYYTRYILPGLTFVVLFIFLPVLVLKRDLLSSWGTGEAILVVVVGLVSGYVLDVAGTYGWLNRNYQEARLKYLMEVAEILYPSQSLENKEDIGKKATVVLGRFWARDPEQYQELIEAPRAKWVLALQAAFLCRLSSGFWGVTFLVELLVQHARTTMYLSQLLVVGMLCVGLFWLGWKLSKRGLTLARLTDTVAITVLNDNQGLLTDEYTP